ncbi:hypothetical protein GZH49_20025 [Nocardia terpenica]|uniref:hypothetical protein n=1 Tax=Nocardia terpenica TaxID=455432 RepID=UPI002FE2FD07
MEFETLRAQVAVLQAKTISATELLELTIARIEKFDDKVNAAVVMQILDPCLEDHTPPRFAELVEQEFGGFTPPLGFA